MKVLNVHERAFPVSSQALGALVDSLSSPKDALWPRFSWPRMQFDRPLGVGAQGGHGPIRYTVEAYEPGRSVRFRFTSPRGFDGSHQFEVVSAPDGTGVLRHTVDMNAHGPALASWPLIFGPMHDALIEDSFAVAEVSLGVPAQVRRWSPWVRFLRWALSGGAPQRRPRKAKTP